MQDANEFMEDKLTKRSPLKATAKRKAATFYLMDYVPYLPAAYREDFFHPMRPC